MEGHSLDVDALLVAQWIKFLADCLGTQMILAFAFVDFYVRDSNQQALGILVIDELFEEVK
jgi:hypothetical protein